MRQARAGVRECAREFEREKEKERERVSHVQVSRALKLSFVNHGWPFPLDSPSYVE